MQLKVDLNIEDLLKLIKKLPKEYQNRLKNELESMDDNKQISDFQKMLLDGPVMSDEQFAEYQENRILMNNWRIS